MINNYNKVIVNVAVAMARSSSAAGGYTRLQMDDDDDTYPGGPEFSLPAPPAPIDKFGRPQKGATATAAAENQGVGLSPAHIPPPGSEPGSRHRGPRLGHLPPQQEQQTSVTFDRDPPGPPGSLDKHNRWGIVQRSAKEGALASRLRETRPRGPRKPGHGYHVTQGLLFSRSPY